MSAAKMRHATRCSYCDPLTDRRCMEPATHWFTVSGEAQPVMGSVCRAHGGVVLDEYEKKWPGYGLGIVERTP